MTEEEIEKRLKEYVDLHIQYMKEAREIQAKEYARRLNELNHEKETIMELQRIYVLQEAYDVHRNDVDTQLRILNSFKDNMQGRMVAYSSIAFVLSIAVAIVLHFI